MVSDQPTRRVLAELRSAGFSPRRSSGSHTLWAHPGGASVAVPDGHRRVSPGVYRKVRAAIARSTTDEGQGGEMHHDEPVTVSARPRYTAHVTREGRWWMVAVPEVDGLTQARRLSEAVPMARSLIAVTLDVDPDDVEVTLRIDRVGDVEVAERLAQIRRERADLAELERGLAQHTRSLARDLADHDVPQRDIGAVLGVSHQRAHQLLAPR